MNKSAFTKRFYAIVGSGACVLLVLVWVFIKGALSPREFAVAGLFWWIVMFAVLFSLIRSRQRSDEDIRRKQIASGVSTVVLDQDKCVKNIRSMKRLIAVFVVLLGYGLLTTQGGPLLPRFAGAAFDVFLLAMCIHSLMRSQKKLKEITAGLTTRSSDVN
jgi:predicted secreted protein